MIHCAAGETMKANIQNAASGFGQQYSAMMEQLQLVLSDGGDVPPEEMDEASDRMLTSKPQATQKQVTRDALRAAWISTDCEQCTKSNPACSPANPQPQTVSNDINSESQNLSAEYTKSTMDMSTQLGQNMNDAANQASESAGQRILDTAALATDPESELMQNLDASKNNVIAQLENPPKCGTEMKSSADSAAAKVKEKPWYKKVWDAVASVASVIATPGWHCCLCRHRSILRGHIWNSAIALIAAGPSQVPSLCRKQVCREATHPADLQQQSLTLNPMREMPSVEPAVPWQWAWDLRRLSLVVDCLTLSSFGGAPFDQLGTLSSWRNWHWGDSIHRTVIGLGKLGEKLGKSKLSN